MLKLIPKKIKTLVAVLNLLVLAGFAYESYMLWKAYELFGLETRKLNEARKTKRTLERKIVELHNEINVKKRKVEFLKSFLSINYPFLTDVLKVQRTIAKHVTGCKVQIESLFIKDTGDFINLDLKVTGAERNVIDFCNKIMLLFPSYLEGFHLSMPKGLLTLTMTLRIPKTRINHEGS